MIYEINVYGRVQGVGFRYFVQREASLLGINGWVKNMPDGSVKIVCDLTDDEKETFLSKIKKGPSYGRVDRVTINDAKYSLANQGFIIKY